MGKSKRKNKRVLTRNIFPDILKLIRVCVVLTILYISSSYLYEGVLPFFNGYSFYACKEDYIEHGINRGELLILKNNKLGNSYDIVLVEDSYKRFNLKYSSNEPNLGVVVESINIYQGIQDIYNNIISVLKHSE